LAINTKLRSHNVNRPLNSTKVGNNKVRYKKIKKHKLVLPKTRLIGKARLYFLLPICQQVNCYSKNYRTIEERELKNKK